MSAILLLLGAQAAIAQEKSSEQLLNKRAAEIIAAQSKGPQVHDPDVDRVVKAWKDRAARIKTARIQWTLTRLDKAGSFSGPLIASSKRSGQLPLVDTTTELHRELLYREGPLRAEEHGQFWMVDFDHPIDTHKIYGYMADDLKYFTQSSDHGPPQGAGSLSRSDTVWPLAPTESIPVSIIVAPFDSRITRWSQEGPLVRVPSEDDEKALCIHVRAAGTYFWVAKEAPEHMTRLKSLRRDDSVSQDLTVEWRHENGIGAVPEQWILTQFDRDGAIAHVVSGKVTRCEFNIPLSTQDLEVVFPAGARVHDDVRQVMLLADGAGGFVPYSESGRASSRFGVKSIVGVAILIACSMLVMRRWRQRRGIVLC